MKAKGGTSKYAFNSASWNLIRRSSATIDVPSYLTLLVDSYLIGRRLCYDKDNGSKQYIVYVSVLGLLLGSIMYNDILNFLVTSEATIVSYADVKP